MALHAVAQFSFVKRVERCPAGYILVRQEDNPVLDTCIKCPGRSYSVLDAVFPHTLSVAAAQDAASQCV